MLPTLFSTIVSPISPGSVDQVSCTLHLFVKSVPVKIPRVPTFKVRNFVWHGSSAGIQRDQHDSILLPKALDVALITHKEIKVLL